MSGVGIRRWKRSVHKRATAGQVANQRAYLRGRSATRGAQNSYPPGVRHAHWEIGRYFSSGEAEYEAMLDSYNERAIEAGG